MNKNSEKNKNEVEIVNFKGKKIIIDLNFSHEAKHIMAYKIYCNFEYQRYNYKIYLDTIESMEIGSKINISEYYKKYKNIIDSKLKQLN